jgi:hypothetical protein
MMCRKMLLRTAIAGVLLAGSAVACGPDYERTEFSGVVADDFTRGGSSAISVRHITVHEGMILKSHIVSWNDDDETMPLDVRSEDPGKLEVGRVITPHDFVFIGRSVGKTRVSFRAGGELVLIVEADVLPQPEAAGP